MSSTRSPRRCWKHLLRALPVAVAVALLTLALGHTGWTSGLETAALDGVLLGRRPLEPKYVVVVNITDEDYLAEDLFNETSPLDPRIVHALIEAIAQGGAIAIGVDLDTSARKFRDFTPSPGWPPVVWACGAEPVDEGHRFRVGGVLGGEERSPAPARGIALLPASFDSVLREYRRWFSTTEGELQPSFPRALAERAGLAAAHDEGEHGEDLILNALTGPSIFPRISARDVLTASASVGWRESGPLLDKVVLLGGTYRAGRDRHRTPAGDRDGVELMAQAVELELQNAGIRPVGHGSMFLVELCSGLVLAWISCRFPHRAGLFLSVLALALGVTSSLVVFATFALWANFALPLLGFVLHLMYDRARESREKIRELELALAQRQSPAATKEPQ